MRAPKTTLHHEIANRIVAEIKSGKFEIDSLLPSEPQLAREYEVSRSTVRAALAALQSLGLVERRQGSGTRVVSGEASPVYIHSMRARGDLLQFAGPSTRRIHTAEEIIADESLALRLDNRPGRSWLRIGQTRHLNDLDMPIGWTDVFVPIQYKDVLEQAKRYQGLIYTLVEKKHNVIVTNIVQSIRAVDIPQHLAAYFGDHAGDKALELTRRYRNSAHECEMVSISVLPERHYTYEITLTRQGSETTL